MIYRYNIGDQFDPAACLMWVTGRDTLIDFNVWMRGGGRWGDLLQTHAPPVKPQRFGYSIETMTIDDITKEN